MGGLEPDYCDLIVLYGVRNLLSCGEVQTVLLNAHPFFLQIWSVSGSAAVRGYEGTRVRVITSVWSYSRYEVPKYSANGFTSEPPSPG